MNEELRALLPSKSLIFGAVSVLAVIVWIVASPGEPRSANPWSSNYDPSLNNSGPELRRVTKITVERAYRDQDGVIHQREDMKAIDAEKYK